MAWSGYYYFIYNFVKIYSDWILSTFFMITLFLTCMQECNIVCMEICEWASCPHRSFCLSYNSIMFLNNLAQCVSRSTWDLLVRWTFAQMFMSKETNNCNLSLYGPNLHRNTVSSTKLPLVQQTPCLELKIMFCNVIVLSSLQNYIVTLPVTWKSWLKCLLWYVCIFLNYHSHSFDTCFIQSVFHICTRVWKIQDRITNHFQFTIQFLKMTSNSCCHYLCNSVK